ncbi:MAG: hypothetical protein ACLQJF_21100 [Candidatus Sulfotelmatobacter sp.]|jgi:hypothetical protein
MRILTPADMLKIVEQKNPKLYAEVIRRENIQSRQNQQNLRELVSA